ncbi:protein bicaudal C homolog 1-B-like [Pecten maximus]|uniref:protein bicaudal C homolog 1-B-like n=1 Tax=Pecten maximus TaxID=6579 RepID=UPI00145833E6|nr:protein bicaudal C homolog 1-B-like [Pecten maximus]XP_033735393.1 protein bicaudal C homolog 1-B-like [Pecten maximus]XP_033735404.1 protein bicaudal C homolog 1-B-like [Pecten maximus]XP_033735412.1 protein bicaudal C homolog 1-B-like [Pecten maximus]XP_033735419.1 protein bicaudal C homolog 1-B-like [Pecten maximus]XP_033735428.1 protein bicaudal C homolog 1-B-like [Pecten maximus]XP_033735435.1 protein bicaudal C homolog 1-B-like [Pecten maximus]XP_033735443.1 protein bicaudal C homol
MADRLSVPVRPINMRDSNNLSESPTELCDDCLQGSKDELEPGYIEDRFRVDRKKLEQMLQGHLDEDEESAEEFFQRIMDETNTQITWPSKLKIGAKSKKDPHIKVIGKPDDVKAAKDSIMTILDTKSNRVTLKMDVSHTDHSHVIGKGGNNIKRVMQETGCHIHFPDSNRGNNVQEKSNQVSIAGQPAGVESARAQIRELLPLVFMFELPVSGVLQPLPDASSPTIQQLQQQYNVVISFRQRPRVYATTVIVRGSVCNAKSVKEGTASLMEHLTSNVSAPLPVSMQLEIAPQHHLFIIGRGGMNVKQIMTRTGASIHFPDPTTVTPQRKGTFYITGNIESVFLARQHLIGCLPLVLMFDVKDEIDMDQARITQLMEQLDVFISVKPKPKQPSKSVIVKSIERNAPNMYLARLTMLGLKRDDKAYPITKAVDSEAGILQNNGLGLSTLGFLSQNLLSVNTTNALLMLNGSQGGHSSPNSVPQNVNVSCSSPNHWVTPPPGIYGPMVVLNSSTTCSVQNQLDLISQCGELHNKDLPQNGSFINVPISTDQVTSTTASSTNSPSQSPCQSPISMGQSASPVDLASLQKANAFGNLITRETSPTGSCHTLDLLGLSKTVGSHSPLFRDNGMGRPTLDSNLSPLQNGERSSESGAESDGSDKLAPGIERKNSNANLFPTWNMNTDYEQRKLMANKAMQKKPEGESRIPTDYWAGMGFSKSMPESAIREKFGKRFENNQYTEPSMATTYESPNEGCEEEEIDRDPWKDSVQQANKPINPAPGEYPSPRKKYEVSLSSSNYVDSACLPSVKNLWAVKTDIAELFSKLGLGKYTDLFQQQEIDLATFLTLTDQDLRELGISTFGARRKMLLAITDLNKGRAVMNSEKMPNHIPEKVPPGFAPRHNTNIPGKHPDVNQPLMASRSITGNRNNTSYADNEVPVFPQRAITGKQFSDSDGSGLHTGMALHNSSSSLRSSGAGLHGSGMGLQRTSPLGGLHHSGALHSSTSSLHGSGHMTRKTAHFLDGSGPRQITGGFSSSGVFSSEGFGQGLTGRQITRGLSASFQESSSLSQQQLTSTTSSPFIDTTRQRNSRSDLANLSARW